MNLTLIKIISSREDISDYLFHFTKGRNAFDTLVTIVFNAELLDINKSGVICFSESPLTLLKDMFEIFANYKNPMYAPYGVGYKKDILFDMGARLVIYGLPKEKEKLSDDIKWRFEEYIPKIKDFTWLREWRLPQDKLILDSKNCFIITKTKEELENILFNELGDIDIDGDVSDGQFWGEAIGKFQRTFKGISIEDIEELNKLSKHEVEQLLTQQNDEDTIGKSLGGVG